MKPTQDPPRLFGAPSSGHDLRDALAGARADLPSADRIAAMAARLPLGSAGSGSAGRGGGAPPAAPAASLLPAIGIGAALAIAVLVAGSLSSASRDAASSATAPSAVVTLVAPVASAPADPAPSTPQVIAPAPTTRASSPQPSAALSLAVDDDETEIHLLQRAQDALSADPTRALSLASEHTTRFPKGLLSQEREVIAIGALVSLGRTSEARSRAEAFIARFPTSAHRGRIEVLVPSLSIEHADHKNGDGASPTP